MGESRCSLFQEGGESSCAGRSSDREEGRIGLLMGASLFFVAVFVFISSAITAVSIEDRRLLACADRVAAATAGIVDSLSYFNQEGALSLNVSEKESWNVAQEALSSLGASTCDFGDGVELLDLEREGDSVHVLLGTRARLPIVPQVIAGSVGPVLTQWSNARVGAAQ